MEAAFARQLLLSPTEYGRETIKVILLPSTVERQAAQASRALTITVQSQVM